LFRAGREPLADLVTNNNHNGKIMESGVSVPLPRIVSRYTQTPLFRPFYLKEFDMARYVGTDLAKRTMEVWTGTKLSGTG
jgi:hypothetical protein